MDVDDLVASMRSRDDEFDKYRLYWETSSDWNDRKQFLAHNWDIIHDKEKLISLSCAWANVRFLGNHYPQAVMRQLQEMEDGLKLSNDHICDDSSYTQPKVNPVFLLYNPDKLPKNFIQVRFVKSSAVSDDSQLPVPEGKVLAENNANVNVSLNSIANCNEISNYDNPGVDSATSIKHKIPDNSNADCENLTKKLKSALKIPENPLSNTSVSRPAFAESTLQVIQSSDIVNDSCKNLCLKVESFAAAIKHLVNLEASNIVSTFFNVAVDLNLNPKFICGMANEEHVSLFDQWKCQTEIQHNLTNFCWVCDLYINEVYLSQGYGKTVSIAKDLAVTAALNLLKSPFTVDLIDRSISSSMCASQYAVKLKQLINTYVPPPVVTLKGAPVIKIMKKSSSSAMLEPAKSETVKMMQTSNVAVINDTDHQQEPVHTAQKNVASFSTFADSNTAVAELSEDLKLKKLLKTRLSSALSNFVVVVFADSDDPVQSLNCTASMNKIQLTYNYNTYFRRQIFHTCSVCFNSVELVGSTHFSKDSARLAAVTKLLKHLIAYFPCMIKLKFPENSDKGLKISDMATGKSFTQPGGKPIANNNIGNQLLRKMGWSGSGGLGKLRDGIAEPVKISGKSSRCVRGLGHEKFMDEKKHIAIVKQGDAERVIGQYISEGCVGNLCFSSELSREDRKQLHSCASKYGLKSKSFGKGSNRHLVLFKNLSLSQIYQELLVTGGELNGYILPS